MLSCDTFALSPEYFVRQANALNKNSDRPLGEAQPLIFFPAADHAPGETLTCTHLTIEQAAHTYAMIGSKPYWIWGFEMGYNEKGLMIGNEAEGSKCEAETEEGLLGMDILRLALERAATAREAIDVIDALLTRYGQNANASMLFDRRYENSFMLVDPNEIWLMETAGRHWAARKISTWAAISNCYSIRSDYDLCSPGMEAYARERRWVRPGKTLDFAQTFTAPAVRQTAAIPRWRRMMKLISAANGALDEEKIKGILRDHFEDELIAPRFGSTYGNFVTICMHAATWDASQTAASLYVYMDDVLGPVARYAPSLPCCSVYLPVYFTGKLPGALSAGSGKYDENALWWRTERLAMLISADEERFGGAARAALRRLEKELSVRAEEAEQTARAWMAEGKKEQAFEMLDSLTESAVSEMMALTKQLSEDIAAQIRVDGGLYGPRKEFLEDYALRSGLPTP